MLVSFAKGMVPSPSSSKQFLPRNPYVKLFNLFIQFWAYLTVCGPDIVTSMLVGIKWPKAHQIVLLYCEVHYCNIKYYFITSNERTKPHRKPWLYIYSHYVRNCLKHEQVFILIYLFYLITYLYKVFNQHE